MSRKNKKKRAASKAANQISERGLSRDPIYDLADNFLFAGTLLILFFRPFLSGRTYPQYNHFFHIGVALLAMVWLAKCWRKRVFELHNRLQTGFMFAFLLVCALTFFTTVNKGITLRYIYEILSYTLLYLIIANNFRDKSWIKAAVVVLIASGLLVNIYGLFQRYYTLEMTRRYIEESLKSGDQQSLMGVPLGTGILHRLESTRVFSTFLYPNAYAMYLAMLGGLMIGWTWSTRQAMMKFAKESLGSLLGHNPSFAKDPKDETRVALTWRLLQGSGGLFLLLLFLIACVVVPWDLWMTYSRGGWGSALIVALVFVTVGLWERIPRAKVAAFIFTAIILASVITSTDAVSVQIIPERNVSLLSRLRDSTALIQRLSYWKAALEMVKHNPWVGIGWGAFESAYPRYMILGGYPVKLAHNNYLQVWAETGIVGLNAFVGLWLVFLYSFWRKVRPGAAGELRGIACGLGAGIIGFLVNSLVDFGLYLPTLAYLLFAFLGLLTAIPTEEEEDKFSFPFPTLAAATLVVACSVYVLFLYRSFVALYLFTLAESERNMAFPTQFAVRKGFEADPELQLRTLTNVIPILEKSSEYFSLDSEVYHLLGDTYLRLAEMKQEPHVLNSAIEQFRQATELNPLSPYAFQSLATAYWVAGNAMSKPDMFQKALAAECKASQNFPVSPIYHEKLVQIYSALGLKKEAQNETALVKELRKHYREY